MKITFSPVIGRHSLEVSVGFDYRGDRFWANWPVQTGEGETVYVQFEPLQILTAVFPRDRRAGEVKVRCHNLDHNHLFVRYTHYGPEFFENANPNSSDIPNGTVAFGGLNKDLFSFSIDTSKIPPCFPFCP